MKKIFLLLVLGATLSQGCAMERSLAYKNDNRSCVVNFSSSGSAFGSGKQFRTYEVFKDKTKDVVFDKVLTSITSMGCYQIVSTSKDSGYISASQIVLFGEGKTVPTNIIVKEEKESGRVKVEIVKTLSFGLVGSADGIQESFCQMLAGVK
ncbi:MAG: hypothetical protein OEL83_17430 [Desulforhopalus sp.]|nr:hypothetical protein [Desulforhopalus sp.]